MTNTDSEGTVNVEQAQQPKLDVVQFNPNDPVILAMQETGKLPATWWTSESAWKMLARLCGQLANSSMVPSAYRNEPGNVMVALTAGMPLGLNALACLQSFAVINGKPTLYGDAPMAQVLSHPSCVDIREIEEGDIKQGTRKWTIEIDRKLPSGTVRTVRRSFSQADADMAGLSKKEGPWRNYPDRMLYNRARAYAVRDSFADVLSGVTIMADDTEDIVTVPAVVRESKPVATVVDEAASLAPPTEAPAEEKPKAKRTRKAGTDAEQAEAAAALNKAITDGEREDTDEPKARSVVSAKGGTTVRVFCESMTELVADGIALDTIDGSVYVCDGNGWKQVTPDNAGLWTACIDFLSETFARELTKKCMARRMEADDAMEWAKTTLDLKKAPAKFLALTFGQLASLWAEAKEQW